MKTVLRVTIPTTTARCRSGFIKAFPIVLIAVLLNTTAHARIKIEEMQRRLQAIYHYRHCGDYVDWPGCPCGRPAPHFPPEGFYGDLDNDPEIAVTLVADLANKFFNYSSVPIWDSFTKTSSLDGSTTGYTEPFTEDDFKRSGPGWDMSAVSRANYTNCAAILYGYLQQIKHAKNATAGLRDLDSTCRAIGHGSGTTCGEASATAYADSKWKDCPNDPPDPVRQAAYGKRIDSTNFYAEVTSVRRQLYCSACSAGKFKIYIAVTNYPGGTGGTEPVAADGAFHQIWDPHVSDTKTVYGDILGGQRQSVSGCTDDGITYGWKMLDVPILTIFDPDLDQAGDGVPNCDSPDGGCGGGGCHADVPGAVSATTSSMDVRISLGKYMYGLPAGFFYLHADQPSAALYQSAALQPVFTAPINVSRDSDGNYTEVHSSTIQAIFETNTLNYTIWFSNIVDSPHTLAASVTISNKASTNKFLITEVLGAGGSPRTIEFDFNPATTNWTKIEGAGLLTESRTTIRTTPTNRTDFVTLSDASGIASSKTVQTRLFPWGETKVQETIGTGASAKTTIFTYAEDPSDTNNYGQLTQKTDSTGHWEKYQNDLAGRTTNKVVQFLDNAITTPDSSNRVTQTIYDDANRTIITIEKVANVEIGRTYQVQFEPVSGIQEVQTIRCQIPEANINNAANLTNIVWRYNGNWQQDAWQPVAEQNPDETMTFYERWPDSPGTGQKTTIVRSGVPSSDQTYIIDGTESTTIVGPFGEILTNYVTDIASSWLITDTNCYVYADNLKRSYTVIHMDGTSESVNYACCGLDNTIDRDGATSQYIYDAARRQIGSTRHGITVTNALDGANQIVKTVRVGRDGSQIRTGSASYYDDGRIATRTNALGGVTFVSYGTNTSGQPVITSTFPDGGTRIETYHQDGSLFEVSGTGAAPTRYLYGVDADGPYTTEIKLSSTGGTNEWVKTSTDMQGRAYKTTYSVASGPNPHALSTFNAMGQLTNTVDPDGVINLYAYSPKGEQVLSVLDSNRNYAIDFDGTDRITFTTNDVVTDHGATMRRTRTYVWSTVGSSASNIVSVTETSADGLQSWRTTYADPLTPVTWHSATVFGADGYRYMTNVQPDGSYTLNITRYGTNVSSTRFDSLGAQLFSISYLQDSHGRPSVSIDARNGGTTNDFNAMDEISATKTPPPSASEGSQKTFNSYDTSGREYLVWLPDLTFVYKNYNAMGLMTNTHGSRTYPVNYTYDAHGRMSTMTTFKNYSGNSGTATTTWNYDQYRGWLDNKRYADNTGPNYEYTGAGRLSSRAWARGTNTSYSHNNVGDMSGAMYDDGITAPLSSTFDRRGREITTIQGSVTTSRTFNDAGKQLTESYSGGPLDGLTVSSAFDEFLSRTNRVLQSAIGNLQSNYFAYDNASRLKTVTDGTNSAAYTRLANSSLIGQTFYTNNGALRMTRLNQFDNLNRLTNLVWQAGSTPVATFAYQYNNANQRTRLTLADGSYWSFGYDSLGQLTSGKHYWSDDAPVVGQQYDYGYDEIGNRTVTRVSGDQFNGSLLRTANYNANLLNQYTSRDVPGFLNVFGSANSNATVSLWTSDGHWGQTIRHGDWYRGELAVNNSTGAIWLTITNLGVLPNGTNADIIATKSGNAFIPRTPEMFGYDPDGNMTNDGRFAITWDAENRATSFTSLPSTPAASRVKIDCTYDSQWRRTQKIVSTWNPSTLNYQPSTTNKFVYDGWNLIAILDHTNGPLYSFTWGLDLSGTEQGVGGIGGLVSMRVHSGALAGTYFYIFDGNGNVMMLINASNGSIAAQYEYGPFGELLRATGPLAQINPYRFSTKIHDDETGSVYYGYRYYSASTGRWLSRDPLGEESFMEQKLEGKRWRDQEKLIEESKLPCHLFVRNSPVVNIDPRGLDINQIWGKWCGSGWTAGKSQDSTEYDWENDPTPETKDGLDNCCRKHDACWANWDLDHHKKLPGKPDTNKCDDLLCDCARANWSVRNARANAEIQCVMCSRRNANAAKESKCACPVIRISISW